MCGIFGICSANGRAVDLKTLAAATDILRHRGPDDEGYLLANTRTGQISSCGGNDTDPRLALPRLDAFQNESFDLAFGFRRLSIIDLSPSGHQPMPSVDNRYWILFNGEIYNYIELRTELESQGFSFRSRTDTEVILAAYQHWGTACLKRFNGMWAFVIWDRQQQSLFLARDPFGIKPLYYTGDGSSFAFASETKSLLQVGWINRKINPRCLLDYLDYGLTDSGGDTFFKEIKQIPPAHYLIVQLNGLHVSPPEQYWQIDRTQRLDISLTEAASKLQEIFLNNIKLHLRSDVAVGSALSGGIDSSAIVASMRHLSPEKLDIHTFSFIADDPAINEERWIDMVGTQNAAKPHKVHILSEELKADLDWLIYSQDMPFGSTSIYAQHRVFRLAHTAGIKVMLDGQGADETLAGYPAYCSSRLASLLRQFHWLQAISFWRKSSGYLGWNGISLMGEAGIKAFGTKNIARLKELTLAGARIMPNRQSANVNNQWFTRRGVKSKFWGSYDGPEILKSHLVQTLTNISLPSLLRYEDRNSMAVSIESRVPFLTTELVSFVLSLPEDYLISPDGITKSVFRQAMRGIVPDPILERRDKIGFQTSEREWITSLRPWVESVLKSDAAARIPVLDLKNIESHWRAVLKGQRRFDRKIWSWLNLIKWSDLYKVDYE